MREMVWVALVGAIIGLAAAGRAEDALEWVGPNDPHIAVMGRVDRTDPTRIRVGYPGVTLRLRFTGAALSARLLSSSGETRIAVIVDDGCPRVVHVTRGENDYVLATGLGAGEHLVEIVHRTETWQGILTVAGFRLAPGGALLDPPPWPRRRLLVVGDSVTCGEGVDRGTDCNEPKGATSNGYDSYGMLLARRLDAQCQLVCYGGRGLIRDWRGRRDVLTGPQLFDLALPDEDGPPPPVWDHASYVPDAVIVALGTNDFNLSIGPLPSREEFVPAYVAFVRTILGHFPQAHVFLTEGAIVNDGDGSGPQPRTVLRDYVDRTIAELADPRVHAARSRHYPGDACNAHPTGAQHRLMMLELEPLLRTTLDW